MLKQINRLLLFATGVSLPLETLGAGEVGIWLISPTSAIAALALAFGTLDLVLSGSKIPRSAKHPWLIAFFAAFLLASIYGSLTSGLGPVTYVLIATRYVAVLLFYFLLCQLIATRRDLDAFMWGLVAGGCVAAVSAIFDDSQAGLIVERKRGIGAGANQHAGNLLLILPMSYALFLSVRHRILKPPLIGAALLLTAGVVLAASRSAFLGAVAMGGIWMLRFRRPQDLKYVAAVPVVMVVAVLLAPSSYVERLFTIRGAVEATTGDQRSTANLDASARTRLQGWKASMGAMVSSPFGAGVGNFGRWADRAGYRTQETELVAHNSLLQAGSTMGIVGLIPYVAILLLTWTDLGRAQRVARGLRIRGDPELGALQLRANMVQIGFIGMAVVAQFQPGLTWKGMWTSFALSTAIRGLTERRARALQAADPVWQGEPIRARAESWRAEPA